ncbi:MAG: hypothetical protein F4X92_05380 [Gammaproteobacteria bacterium]|nr:hypothetical protein [Gammaproteobacteria bacterium]
MRLVIFQEEDLWVAVCLEHFIGAQADTMEKLKQRLQTAYAAEREDSLARTGIPFGGIMPAPEKFQKMWYADDRSITRGTIVDKEVVPLDFELAA